jgi:hypothetical protein
LGLRSVDPDTGELMELPPTSPGVSDTPGNQFRSEPRKHSSQVQPSPHPSLPGPPESSRSSGNAPGSDGMEPRSSSNRSLRGRRPVKTRSVSRRNGEATIPVRPIRSQSALEEAQDQATPAQPSNQIKIPAGVKGRITITIDVDGQAASPAEQNQPAVPTPSADDIRRALIQPEKSATVFIDVTAYNSKNYYVLKGTSDRITRSSPSTD